MGFWQGLGRMIAGQPVYQAGDASESGATAKEEHRDGWQDAILPDDNLSEPSADVPQGVKPQDDERITDPYHTAGGQKVVPEVTVRDCETHAHGDVCELWLTLHNDSSVAVMLDKIVMLGRSTELDRLLRPGEQHGYMVYRGTPLKNGAYTKAQVMYKVEATGDYFCADQEIRYHVEPDGSWMVTSLRLIRPVRDV